MRYHLSCFQRAWTRKTLSNVGWDTFSGLLQNGKLHELPFFCFLNEFDRMFGSEVTEFDRMFGSEVMASQRDQSDRKSTLNWNSPILMYVLYFFCTIFFKGRYLTYFNIKCKFVIFVRFLYCFQLNKTLFLMAIGFLAVTFA